MFDGHGGISHLSLGFEVSEYVSQVFVKELTSLEAYKNKDYEAALNEAFKRIDELIESQAGQKELKKIRSAPHATSNSTEESHH